MEKVKTLPGQHQFMSVRQLTVAGFLSAITIFLGLTGYGFIPLIIMNATILHIPTIIGSISAGRRVGMIVGFMFGLFSFIRTLQAPSALLMFAVQYSIVADAFICIIPRIMIGVVAYELYKHLKIREVARVAVTAVVTTVCHTVMFLGSFTAIALPWLTFSISWPESLSSTAFLKPSFQASSSRRLSWRFIVLV